MQATCQAEETVFCQTYLEMSCDFHENQWWSMPLLPLQNNESMWKWQALTAPDILEAGVLYFSSKIPCFLHVKEIPQQQQVPCTPCSHTDKRAMS